MLIYFAKILFSQFFVRFATKNGSPEQLCSADKKKVLQICKFDPGLVTFFLPINYVDIYSDSSYNYCLMFVYAYQVYCILYLIGYDRDFVFIRVRMQPSIL